MVIFRSFLTLVVLIIWLSLFGLGCFVDSNPLREEITKPHNFAIANFLLILISWTPTNVALLSIISGLSGSLSKEMIINAQTGNGSKQLKSSEFTGMIIGFIVYLAFLAGVLIGAEKPFDITTPDQYYRIAGTISFLAFVVSYRPQIVDNLLNRSSIVKGTEVEPA